MENVNNKTEQSKLIRELSASGIFFDSEDALTTSYRLF